MTRHPVMCTVARHLPRPIFAHTSFCVGPSSCRSRPLSNPRTPRVPQLGESGVFGVFRV